MKNLDEIMKAGWQAEMESWQKAHGQMAPDKALELIERLLDERSDEQIIVQHAEAMAERIVELETHIKKLEYWLAPVIGGPKWPVEEGGA